MKADSNSQTVVTLAERMTHNVYKAINKFCTDFDYPFVSTDPQPIERYGNLNVSLVTGRFSITVTTPPVLHSWKSEHHMETTVSYYDPSRCKFYKLDNAENPSSSCFSTNYLEVPDDAGSVIIKFSGDPSNSCLSHLSSIPSIVPILMRIDVVTSIGYENKYIRQFFIVDRCTSDSRYTVRNRFYPFFHL
jgi:hypothetical protein